MDNQIIFTTIAQSLISEGYDITLELKHYERESKALGNFSNSKGIDTGLVLTASRPVNEEDDEEEEQCQESQRR